MPVCCTGTKKPSLQLLEEIESEVDDEKQWRRGFKNTTNHQQDVQYEQEEAEQEEEAEEEDAEEDAVSEMLV